LSKEKQTIGYETIPIFVGKVTEAKLGKSVPKETMDSWRILARSMRIVDSFIDRPEQTPQTRSIVYEEVSKYLSNETEALPSYGNMMISELAKLKVRLALLSDRKRELFLRDGRKIFRATELRKNASDPKTLAKITMLESQISMRMFLDFLPESLSKLDGYEEYVKFSTRSARAASMLDAGIDFNADFAQGQIQVFPSLANKLTFVSTALPTAGYVLREVGPRIFIDLIREGKRTIDHRNSQQHLDSLRESIN